MLAVERAQKIVEITNEKGFVSTKELSQRLNVTEMTIRRDCEDLENQGLIIRVHGGTKSINQDLILSHVDEKKMSERSNIHNLEKEKVCQKAASFIKDGDCIFLDGGTSIVPMIKYIKGKKIKIVTHSHINVNQFNDENAELFVIGGKYIPEYNMNVGPIALSDLDKFNFDYAFFSCAGIDLQRRLVYTAEMDTMAVKQKAMDLAVKNYMLIDSSKFDVKGFCSFISSDDFDAVICNRDENIIEDDLPNNYILVD